MKVLCISTILLILSFSVQAQRHLPYPIIFIHGLSGNANTWDEFNSYLSTQLGLSIDYNNINICLNADGDTRYSSKYRDVYLYQTNLGNRDVYRVNFDVCQSSKYSNESAAVKQGYALRFAISSVLRATGAEKVILFGHSMGGLAAREYIQNIENWQSDGQHHIAKLITLGTPHQGSNLGSGDINMGYLLGYNEASEAVRDLRSSYKTGNLGTYLYGGFESLSVIQRGFGSSFHNIDINSNGYEGDLITGLNQKSIYTNLAYSNVIATGVMGLTGDSDGVVLSSSQDLTNSYNINIDKFYHRCSYSLDLFCHTKEPKEATFPNIYALDEPSSTNLAYQIEFNKEYTGTFTNQANGSLLDQDKFKIFVPQKGLLTFSGSFPASANAKLRIIDQFGSVVVTANNSSSRIFAEVTLQTAGTYFLEITGNSPNGWSSYFYNASFCPIPTQLSLSTNGPTTFCEGQNIQITATQGYDRYQWYLNDQQISGSSNSITTSVSGTYSVQAIKCGVTTSSNNTIPIVVLPAPPKPVVTKEELPGSFQLTSSISTNNQWYFNNQPIQGATSNEHTPEALGNYSVAINQQGCISVSDMVSVAMDKPILTIRGENPLCEGDSTILTAPTGFGEYIFSDGKTETIQAQNTLVVSRTATYTLKTKRGRFISPDSDPERIVVNPLPSKPSIALQDYNLFSSSEANNQWYLNGVPTDTTQILKGLTSGIYVVRVTQLGCYSESDPFVITAIDPSIPTLSFQVYPNPTDGQFWLRLPKNSSQTELIITDLSGRVVLKRSIADHQNTIPISDFKQGAGLYIIKIRSGDFYGIQKLIVN